MSRESCVLCLSPLQPFRAGGRPYHHCPVCDWILLDESQALPLDQQKARYQKHENNLDCRGYVSMFEEWIKVGVEPFAGNGARILDFGCGPEPVLAGLLRERGYQAEIYDPLFYPRTEALSRRYSLIALTEVLEHLPDPLEVLGNLVGQIEEQGTLSVMTLFHPGRLSEFEGWWYRRDPTHVSFYTLKTLRRLAEALDMSVVFNDGKRAAVLRKKGKEGLNRG